MKISASFAVLLLICVAAKALATTSEVGRTNNNHETSGLQGSDITGSSAVPTEKLRCGESSHLHEDDKLAKIINGRDAIPGEFPYQIRLVIESRTFCGGVLIGEMHILTAAHCAEHYVEQWLPSIRIKQSAEAILGDHSKSDIKDGGVTVGLSEVILHQNYSRSFLQDDIALLRLAEPIVYKLTNEGYGSINRVCLPEVTDIKYPAGQSTIVAGWGVTEVGKGSDTLKLAELEVVDDSQCQQAWGKDTEKVICAADKNQIMNICRGDSGGPLVRRMADGRHELVGLVSGGLRNCVITPDYPFFYTRVSHYLEWIKDNMQSNLIN